MRFKVGDKVRVKESLVGGNTYGDIYFGFSMEKYCGKCFVVEKIYGTNVYGLNEAKSWRFSEDMLEPMIPLEKIVIYRDGNKVIAKYYNGDNVTDTTLGCSSSDEVENFDFTYLAKMAVIKVTEKMSAKENGHSWIKCVGYRQKKEFNFTVGEDYKLYDNGDIFDDTGYKYNVGQTKKRTLEFLSKWYIFEEVENPS